MIGLHAAISFLSYLAFLTAVLTGFLFLAEERRLKLKDPKLLSKQGIPLELLDQVNLVSLAIGFILFTFGLGQGYLLARENWGAYFNGDPKEIASALTWGAYALLLALRLTQGLRGRRLVFLSVMSFLWVMFTFAGVNHLTGTRHAFF